MRRKLQQVHARVRFVVPVQHEGHTLALPVWVHETYSTVGEPGSADEMVASFFKWKRIPIFLGKKI